MPPANQIVPTAGKLSDEAKSALIGELKQLRTQLDAAERVNRELLPKRNAIETTLRAYGVNVDTLE